MFSVIRRHFVCLQAIKACFDFKFPVNFSKIFDLVTGLNGQRQYSSKKSELIPLKTRIFIKKKSSNS